MTRVSTLRRSAPLAIGIGLVGLGSLIGLDPAVADAVLRGPAILRAALTGALSVVGVWLLGLALTRIAGHDGGAIRDRGIGEMIRGIRFTFLAVAAFAAASAFLVGHVLPLVAGLIIAGIDIVETALLLLVAGTRREREPEG